jgi:hypothetical protein
MVKRTLEVFECDRCGKEGQRYSVTFPEGTLVMDRCETHARKIEALREETGEWVQITAGGRQGFKKTSLVELRAAVEAARKGPEPRKEPARGKAREA